MRCDENDIIAKKIECSSRTGNDPCKGCIYRNGCFSVNYEFCSIIPEVMSYSEGEQS